MLYPKGTKERAWTAFDTVAPPAIAIEIVPLLPKELEDPAYMDKIESGLKALIAANGWKEETSRVEQSNLPGWLTEIEEPEHARARLYGKYRLYKFASRDWAPGMFWTVRGFREKAD